MTASRCRPCTSAGSDRQAIGSKCSIASTCRASTRLSLSTQKRCSDAFATMRWARAPLQAYVAYLDTSSDSIGARPYQRQHIIIDIKRSTHLEIHQPESAAQRINIKYFAAWSRRREVLPAGIAMPTDSSAGIRRLAQLGKKQNRSAAHRPGLDDEAGFGAPGGIRTPDQWLRKPLLYPAELRARRLAAWAVSPPPPTPHPKRRQGQYNPNQRPLRTHSRAAIPVSDR